MKDITPQRLRCSIGGCPSTHLLDNGKVLMVARIAKAEDIPGDLPPYDLTTEIPVIFDPGLIENVPRPVDGDWLAPFRRDDPDAIKRCVAEDLL